MVKQTFIVERPFSDTDTYLMVDDRFRRCQWRVFQSSSELSVKHKIYVRSHRELSYISELQQSPDIMSFYGKLIETLNGNSQRHGV